MLLMEIEQSKTLRYFNSKESHKPMLKTTQRKVQSNFGRIQLEVNETQLSTTATKLNKDADGGDARPNVG